MESISSIMIQVGEVIQKIKEKNDQINFINEEISQLTTTLEGKLRILNNLQKTPETFVSRLANTPSIKTITIPENTINTITLKDRVTFTKEYTESFEKIQKYYDYKTNTTILRNGKFGKYPRYICRENADSTVVKNLLLLGFIDKIMVDETLSSIAQLPSTITQSLQSYMNSYGPGGIYGIQVFDACTDLTGKPILLCQIFKYGRNTTIEGENTSLKTDMTCTIEQFGDWLCNKRAIGIATLKSKLEDMIRGGKACVIGTSKGGLAEEILTIYYNNDIISRDTTALNEMHARLSDLKHNHAQKTKEIYQNLLSGQRRRPVATLKNIATKEEGCSDPFA